MRAAAAAIQIYAQDNSSQQILSALCVPLNSFYARLYRLYDLIECIANHNRWEFCLNLLLLLLSSSSLVLMQFLILFALFSTAQDKNEWGKQIKRNKERSKKVRQPNKITQQQQQHRTQSD